MSGDEFKVYRTRLGYSQTALAEKLGVSQEMISEIESGAKQCPPMLAKKLISGNFQ